MGYSNQQTDTVDNTSDPEVTNISPRNPLLSAFDTEAIARIKEEQAPYNLHSDFYTAPILRFLSFPNLPFELVNERHFKRGMEFLFWSLTERQPYNGWLYYRGEDGNENLLKSFTVAFYRDYIDEGTKVVGNSDEPDTDLAQQSDIETDDVFSILLANGVMTPEQAMEFVEAFGENLLPIDTDQRSLNLYVELATTIAVILGNRYHIRVNECTSKEEIHKYSAPPELMLKLTDHKSVVISTATQYYDKPTNDSSAHYREYKGPVGEFVGVLDRFMRSVDLLFDSQRRLKMMAAAPRRARVL